MKTAAATTTTTTRNIDFGIADSKGRPVGLAIVESEVVATEIPEESIRWSRLAPGEYFAVQMTTTRAGATFGAWQPSQYFETLAERDAAIAKRIKSAKAKAAKVHA